MLEWQPIELFIACIQFEPKIEMPFFFSQHVKTKHFKQKWSVLFLTLTLTFVLMMALVMKYVVSIMRENTKF